MSFFCRKWKGEKGRGHDKSYFYALEDIIEAANGKLMLVAYWFWHDLERITERMQKLKIPCSQLDTDISIRRWNAGEIPVALIQPEGVKRRAFCSKEYREKWWHSHPEEIRQKAVYAFTCAGCGGQFTAYGNSKRKYCSHECYTRVRFKGAVRMGEEEFRAELRYGCRSPWQGHCCKKDPSGRKNTGN